MLYKFKSPASGDLIMLEPNGRQILALLGRGDPQSLVQGILLPKDMPAAMAALEAAVAQDDAQRRQHTTEAQPPDEDTPPPTVALRQRVVPFMEMLRRCHQADKEIIWGV